MTNRDQVQQAFPKADTVGDFTGDDTEFYVSFGTLHIDIWAPAPDWTVWECRMEYLGTCLRVQDVHLSTARDALWVLVRARLDAHTKEVLRCLS